VESHKVVSWVLILIYINDLIDCCEKFSDIYLQMQLKYSIIYCILVTIRFYKME